MDTSPAQAQDMGGHLVEAGHAKKDGKLPLTAGLEERPIGRLEEIKAVLHPEVRIFSCLFTFCQLFVYILSAVCLHLSAVCLPFVSCFFIF